jgi:hypothetical protein
MAIRNVRQHLSEHHARSASFDLGIASEFSKLRKCLEALETNVDGDDSLKNVYKDAKESIGRLSAEFNGHAQYHRNMGQDVEKGIDVDDLDKLVPTQVSAVVDQAKGPRAVIRPGQRELPADGMPKVDMQFEHLVKVDD